MAADADLLRVGDPVAVHATLQNIGDQAQLTKGYGGLAIVCYANDRGPIVAEWGRYIDAATIAPGAEQKFTVEFRPTDAFVDVSRSRNDRASCMVGVWFDDDAAHIRPLDNRNPPETADSTIAFITVLAARAATTTTTAATTR
jgi:hypothetical protein